MIEINLLPQEQKAKIRRVGKVSIESKYFLYFIPAVVALVIFAHICLAVVATAKNIQLNALNNKWKKLKPERELLNNLKKQYDVSDANAQVIQALNNRSLNWSEKLNRLSLDLPSGIWFNEVAASQKEFVLKASAVSLQKEEMSLIKKFVDNLKNDTRFIRDLGNLELGSVQKKPIGGHDVADFILRAKLNPIRNTESNYMKK